MVDKATLLEFTLNLWAGVITWDFPFRVLGTHCDIHAQLLEISAMARRTTLAMENSANLETPWRQASNLSCVSFFVSFCRSPRPQPYPAVVNLSFRNCNLRCASLPSFEVADHFRSQVYWECHNDWPDEPSKPYQRSSWLCFTLGGAQCRTVVAFCRRNCLPGAEDMVQDH